jgi:MFS family permease
MKNIGKGIRENYNHTIYASYIGYITQAIINNFIPLLFLTFQGMFEISLGKVGFLVTINFGVQLITDMLAIKYVDKIGYRKSVVAAHIFATVGLMGLAIFPYIFSNAYMGVVAAVICYAIGGGIIEVLISPIVEACPTERKEAAMSLLHSFYCWGHVFVVIFSTVFFSVFGIANWRILAFIWAIIPLVNSFYFLNVPIATLVEEDQKLPVLSLVKNKLFWLFVLLMISAGASEQAMSQWASAFAESGLKVSKTFGDLAGPCLFAALMGCARVFYSKFSEKISLRRFMVGSGILCIIGYLIAALSSNPFVGLIGVSITGLSVGILWPGTFSIAAKGLPRGGTAMFAFLALAGDLGCAAGPTVVGVVSSALNDDLKKGILVAIIFPIILLIGLGLYRNVKTAVAVSA